MGNILSTAASWDIRRPRRIIGDGLGGLLLGFLLTIGLGKGLFWIRILPNEQPARSPGWALLMTSLIGWPIWNTLAEREQLWILLALWIAFTIFMKFFPDRGVDHTPGVGRSSVNILRGLIWNEV